MGSRRGIGRASGATAAGAGEERSSGCGGIRDRAVIPIRLSGDAEDPCIAGRIDEFESRSVFAIRQGLDVLR